MFNGIIQCNGIIVESISNNNIVKIKTKLNLNECIIGSSICCDGICLTIIKIEYKDSYYTFSINVSEETNINIFPFLALSIISSIGEIYFEYLLSLSIINYLLKTYLANISNSILTLSLIVKVDIFVRLYVWGIIDTQKFSLNNFAIVREMPLIDIDPFSTINFFLSLGG